MEIKAGIVKRVTYWMGRRKRDRDRGRERDRPESSCTAKGVVHKCTRIKL